MRQLLGALVAFAGALGSTATAQAQMAPPGAVPVAIYPETPVRLELQMPDTRRPVALCQGLEHRDLLRGARSLISEVRAREHELSALETNHPGITRVDRASDGSIMLKSNEASLHSLLSEFESLVQRATASARLKA